MSFGAIIRHGECANEHMDIKYPNPLDPPLTENGMDQAEDTGYCLNKYFKENKWQFDEIIIECSPFLKCMMTASHIAARLSVKEVKINFKASKILTKYNFKKGNPIPELELCKFDCNFVKM